MNIPTFLNIQWVDKNGHLTPDVQIYEDRLNQVMQDSLSDNGWTVPQIKVKELLQIMALPNPMPNGTIYYVTVDNRTPIITPVNLFVGILNGALVQFTTAPYVP